jgi:hypothetical protein
VELSWFSYAKREVYMSSNPIFDRVGINATEACIQAAKEPGGYVSQAIGDLCRSLEIDRNKAGWQARLEPFACVLAAMVTASAQDYDTAIRAGAVAGTLQAAQKDALEVEVTKLGAETDKLYAETERLSS